MPNIINAICNLVENPVLELKQYALSHNRANNMGESLEEYIKDLFANVPEDASNEVRDALIQGAFCYTGNQNNPPDAMLWGGDAIEVKKIESKGAALALNSSYPKHKLYADSTLISNACREAESWTEKDIIYAVGVVDKNSNRLNSLAFVYGEDYCASKECYERIRTVIKSGVESISDIEFAESKELGHINRVDPLGITYMRVRGMWGIDNPLKVFSYVYKRDVSKDFSFMCLINDTKWNSFDNCQDLINLVNYSDTLQIEDVKNHYGDWTLPAVEDTDYYVQNTDRLTLFMPVGKTDEITDTTQAFTIWVEGKTSGNSRFFKLSYNDNADDDKSKFGEYRIKDKKKTLLCTPSFAVR